MKALLKVKILGLLKKSLQSKKSKQSIAKTILMALLFIYVGVVFFGMFYVMFDTIIEPFHLLHLNWLYFAIMAIMVIMLCFIGSVFLTEHELYEAKDNDLLLSMPISNYHILLSRLCTILLLDYVFELLIVIPAFIVYMRFTSMHMLQIITFMIVILTLPFMVMALTMIMAWLVATIMKKIRYKNIVTVVLWLVFFSIYMFVVMSIQDYIVVLIQNGESIAQAIEKSLFPIYHLALSISESNIISLGIYLLSVFIPFGIVFYILSINFIKLTTSKGKEKKRIYKEKPMKEKGLLYSLYIREIKHFFSNPMIILNGMTGTLMTVIACVALCFYKDDLRLLVQQLPFLDIYVVAIACIISISMGSLNIISASLISLEGQNLWILKSLPIQEKDILLAKLLLHLSICLPGHILFGLVISIILGFSVFDSLLVIIVPCLMTTFVALIGLLLNLWKPRFDWINETVCVKQSMPAFLTMLIAMSLAFVIGFGYLTVFYDMMSIRYYIYIVFAVFVILDSGLYYLLMTYGTRKWKLL